MFDPCECVDPVGGIFVLPPDPLEEQLYLLVQFQRGSPFRLNIPGDRGGQ